MAVGAVGGIEYWTGIGLRNESEKAVRVLLGVFLPDGTLERSTAIDLRPHQQMATLLTELLGEPAYRRVNGYIKIEASSPIAAIAFYGDSRNHFLTTVPAIAP